MLTTRCQSYLSGRSQLVCINGKNSSLACMNHRVPEGYIWVLFVILFTNDLPRHVTAQVDLYADDTTITCSADYKSMHKLEHDLNNSVAEIQNWAVSNKLPINVHKTDVMIVTGKNIESKLDFQPSWKLSDHELVRNVSSGTLLGLDIDSPLSFSQHADKICKKLCQRIALLRKMRVYLPLKQRLLYYTSIIHPLITYAIVIWSCCDKESLNRVLKLQKRAARVVLSVHRDSISVQLLNKLNWIPFYEENKIRCCSLIFKLIQVILPNYLIKHFTVNSKVHSRNTRYAKFNFVFLKYIREIEGGKSLVRACKLWNKLFLELKRKDFFPIFKRRLFDIIFIK